LKLPPFYPVLDSGIAARLNIELVSAAEAILEGGARILQLRHKGFYSRELFGQAERIRDLCLQAGATFVVNDRADVAMMLGCGLHVGQEDLPPATARRLMGKGALLGFSTHNEVQLREGTCEPVDYLALGPIFETVSKLNPDPVIGLNELRRLRAMTDLPLVAIGGIKRAAALDVLLAGAVSVAIISDLFPDPCVRQTLRTRTEEWIQQLSNREPRS
jgi:thiamine-phosphate pyrophosphorylase